jgi:hypothetical protein
MPAVAFDRVVVGDVVVVVLDGDGDGDGDGDMDVTSRC